MDADGGAKPVYPCKARDMFAAAEDVFPVTFTGGRVHVLLKSREPWALAHGLRPPPAQPPGWSAASAFKLSTNGPSGRPGATVRLAGTLGARSRLGYLACGTVEADPASGNWSFETVFKSAAGAWDASAVGQVCAWRRPLTCRLDVDHVRPAGALSVTVDPVREHCAFQCRQAVSRRLSLGVELGFSHSKDAASFVFRPAVLARYAGPAYLVCGKVDPLAGDAKFTWYRHNNDRLQTSVTLEVDRPRSIAVARMAFRMLSGRSVIRGSVDTNGVVSSLLERQLAGDVSASLSVRIEHKTGRSGLGAGLSFG